MAAGRSRRPARSRKSSGRYRDGTLILDTTFETADGVVTLIDGMAIRAEHPVLIRSVRGERGQVPMRLHLVIRFDYGSIVPWVTRLEEGGIRAVAGPDTLLLRTPVPLQGADHSTVAEFTDLGGRGSAVHALLARLARASSPSGSIL
jgi:hypothetical protein